MNILKAFMLNGKKNIGNSLDGINHPLSGDNRDIDDRNILKGHLTKDKVDRFPSPAPHDTKYHLYSSRCGKFGGYETRIFPPDKTLFYISPEAIAAVLDETASKCKNNMKYVKNIRLVSDKKALGAKSINLAQIYGLPVAFNPNNLNGKEDELVFGTHADFGWYSPGISEKESYEKLGKGIIAYVFYRICKDAIAEENKERGIYSLCYANKNPTPYQEFIIDGTYKYYDNDSEYIKATNRVYREIGDTAKGSINRLTEAGILYFTDPQKLKEENPFYYQIISNLAQGVDSPLHREIKKINKPVRNKNQIIVPREPGQKTHDANGTNYLDLRNIEALRDEAIAYNRGLIVYPINIYRQYFSVYSPSKYRINNGFGYDNFVDWLNEEKESNNS